MLTCAPPSRPYTKDVVVAMQMRIDALEYELAALHVSAGSTPLPTGVQFYGGPALAPRCVLSPDPYFSLTPLARRNVPQDAFQGALSRCVLSHHTNRLTGGLALNTHGELRFYGPTSSYRTMIADSSSLPRSKVSAAQAFSLTRAPLPTAIPADPVLPRRPPVLEEAFRNRVVRLAFEYGFSQFNLVQEQEFCVDMLERPCVLSFSPASPGEKTDDVVRRNERTSDYSPFLYNIVLAIGCRYLSDSEPSPIEICGEMDDLSTRGDVFISWARYSASLLSLSSAARSVGS